MYVPVASSIEHDNRHRLICRFIGDDTPLVWNLGSILRAVNTTLCLRVADEPQSHQHRVDESEEQEEKWSKDDDLSRAKRGYSDLQRCANA